MIDIQRIVFAVSIYNHSIFSKKFPSANVLVHITYKLCELIYVIIVVLIDDIIELKGKIHIKMSKQQSGVVVYILLRRIPLQQLLFRGVMQTLKGYSAHNNSSLVFSLSATRSKFAIPPSSISDIS